MFYFEEDDYNAVLKVMKSGKLFRYQGKDIETECLLFEKEFSSFLGGGYAVTLTSGTNALINAMKTLGVSLDDEVIVPAYTFFATVLAVINVGARPVVVNIKNNLSFNVDELKEKITNKTRAIIAVHMDGVSCEIDELKKICNENNIYLIEDVAQAVGGEFNGKKLGSFGDAGCFSFNMDKNITAGEGGAVFFNDQVLYQKAMLYHDGCNQFGPTMINSYTIDKFVGASMRISEIQGALLRTQLNKLPRFMLEAKKRYLETVQVLQKNNLQILDEVPLENICGNVVRLKLPNPEKMKEVSVKLNGLGFKVIPPLVRPAHSVWQWIHYVSKERKFSKVEFLPSIEILSSILLLYVDVNCTEIEWSLRLNTIEKFD